MNIEDRKLAALIRATLPPLSEPTPAIDLWPSVERRLDARRASVSKLDWIVAALALGLLASFPEVVLWVFYHL